MKKSILMTFLSLSLAVPAFADSKEYVVNLFANNGLNDVTTVSYKVCNFYADKCSAIKTVTIQNKAGVAPDTIRHDKLSLKVESMDQQNPVIIIEKAVVTNAAGVIIAAGSKGCSTVVDATDSTTGVGSLILSNLHEEVAPSVSTVMCTRGT